MATRNESARKLKQWQKSWLVIAQGAVWVIGIVGSFLLPPPVGDGSGEGREWERLAQFILAISVGLLILAGRQWNQHKHVGRWIGVSAASLFAGVAMFFLYQYFLYAWTCEYDTERRVIGTEYTEQARLYLDGQGVQEMPCDLLLDSYTGNARQIWTAATIGPRRLVLAGVYLLAMPLFTVCLIATAQAMECFKEKKRRSRS